MRVSGDVVLGREDHGGAENLVTEHVAAQETAITVSEVQAFMESDIGHVSEVGMP